MPSFNGLDYEVIHCAADVNYCPGRAITHVTLEGQRSLALKGTYHRFGVGAIPRGFAGRKETGGTEIAGPWAFAFGLATVIDNRPDLRAAERATDLEVANGDLIMVDAVIYRVRVVRREFIELDAVRSIIDGEVIGEEQAEAELELAADRDANEQERD